jgi:hypothetical protein
MELWAVVLVSLVPIILLGVVIDRRNRASGNAGYNGEMLDPASIPRLSWRRDVLPYVACYVCYAILLGMEYVVFVIWRATIINLIDTFVGASQSITFLYIVGTVLLGVSLFILALVAEPMLRTGVQQHRLVRRFLRFAVALGIAGVLGVLLTTLTIWIAP